MHPPSTVLSDHKWFNVPKGAVYNAHDTYNTARLARALRRTLDANGQLGFYEQWASANLPVVLEMQRRGVGQVDAKARKSTRKRIRDEIREVESAVLSTTARFADLRDAALAWRVSHEQTYGPDKRQRQREIGYQSRLRKADEREGRFFNASNDLRDFLYDELGLTPAPPTRKRTKRSTAQDALLYVLDHLRQRDEPHRTVLHDLFHRSRLHTIDTRYLNLKPWPDGRLRPTVKLGGTKTLRLAYADPALQQWPKDIRDIIVPRPGHVFLAADYSQLEARILAVLALDQASLKVFAEGGDVHQQNAADCFGIEPGDVTPLLRAWGKGFLYKISYGGRGDSEQQKLFCPCPRCEHLMLPEADLTLDRKRNAEARWFQIHHRVRTWRNELAASIAKGGHYYMSPFGWKRYFFTPVRRALPEIYNFPMQHCAAMIVSRAMQELHVLGAPMCLQMHDEVMLEVPERDAPAWARVLVETMQRPVPELSNYSFPVDVSVGESWGSLEELAV